MMHEQQLRLPVTVAISKHGQEDSLNSHNRYIGTMFMRPQGNTDRATREKRKNERQKFPP